MASDIVHAMKLTSQLWGRYQEELSHFPKGTNNQIDSYVQAANNLGMLSAKEQRLLTMASQNGSVKAQELLVLSNYRSALKASRSYKSSAGSTTDEDLAQAAIEGLIKSIREYDTERKEASLLSFSQYYVRNSLNHVARKEDLLIRLPSWLHDMWNTYRRAYRLVSDNDYSAENIARIMNEIEIDKTGKPIPPGQINSLLEYIENKHTLTSLDLMLSDDTSSETIGDRVSAYTQDPLDSLDESISEEIINQAELTPLQRFVICRFYGLQGFSPTSAEQISQEIGDATANRVSKALQSARSVLESQMFSNDEEY